MKEEAVELAHKGLSLSATARRDTQGGSSGAEGARVP